MSADLLAAFGTENPVAGDTIQNKLAAGLQANIDPSKVDFSRGGHSAQVQQKTSGELSSCIIDPGIHDVQFDPHEATYQLEDFGEFETAPNQQCASLHPSSILNQSQPRCELIESAGETKHTVMTEKAVDLGVKDSDELTNLSFGSRQGWLQPGTRSMITKNLQVIQENDSEWDDEWGEFETTKEQGIRKDKSVTILAEPADMVQTEHNDDNDGWDEFEDGLPDTYSKPLNQISGKEDLPVDKRRSPSENLSVQTDSKRERPTNVPPPSMLLQLLITVLNHLRTKDNEPTSLSERFTLDFSLSFRVTCRIISGRMLRWKRDTILAQSMRIGHAGKSGGMKLTSVNKGETIKEEREADELIAYWSRHAHEFKHALLQIGQALPRVKMESLTLVSLSQQSLHGKQCAVCGLRREEKVKGMDDNEADLFDEYWIDFWGHRDCYEFWYSYNSFLGQR